MKSNMYYFLLLFSFIKVSVLQSDYDYCIIGAGPAGLQLSYFLQKNHRKYIVFEKGSSAGTFSKKYPIHRKLISINKRFTGSTNKEFNMRHDWNSLISDGNEIVMTSYSKDLFPDATTYVNYLNDFSQKFKLNIKFNTNINGIEKYFQKGKKYFKIFDQKGNRTTCKLLIIATGISKPNDVKFAGRNLTLLYGDLKLA